MYRRYRRVTVMTLTIDCVFLVVKTPFKIVSAARQLRPTNKLVDIDGMSGLQFERKVAQLLRKRGYQHIRLTERYDYGIDIIASKDGIKWGIQVKRHSGLVKASAVRQAVTALNIYSCDRAMVITNCRYSRIATRLALSNDCKLIDRKTLATWL